MNGLREFNDGTSDTLAGRKVLLLPLGIDFRLKFAAEGPQLSFMLGDCRFARGAFFGKVGAFRFFAGFCRLGWSDAYLFEQRSSKVLDSALLRRRLVSNAIGVPVIGHDRVMRGIQSPLGFQCRGPFRKIGEGPPVRRG